LRPAALLLVLVLAPVAGMAGAGRGGPSAVDARGRTVHLAAPARRIVSLAPHITEVLFAAGAGARVVGAVDDSNYPPAARRVPRVGGPGHIDQERVLALHPDLVVAWGSGNPPGQIAALERLGLPVYVSEPRRLADISHDLRALGRLAGTAAAGRAAAQSFHRRLERLRRRYGSGSPVSVFFQVSAHPLMTVTGHHIISKVLRLCGGRNVFAQLGGLAPQVSVEAVLSRAPEAIVFSRYPGQSPRSVRAQWHRWQALPAVARGDLFGVPADLISRPTPRILDGAARICKDLDEVRTGAGPEGATESTENTDR